MKRHSDPRHNTRQIIMCILYALNTDSASVIDTKATINLVHEALNLKFYDKTLFRKLSSLFNQIEAINLEINNNSIEWNTRNFFKIDLAILQLAVFELENTDTPFKVVIDEAIELAKEFSTDLSSKFINGFLASIATRTSHKIYDLAV